MNITDELRLFAKAIADDTRYEIMRSLCCVWLSVNEVVAKLDGRVNQPTVSHHLKWLEEAGLVFVRKEGRQRFYSLNTQHISLCCGQLWHSLAPEQASQIIPADHIESRD